MAKSINAALVVTPATTVKQQFEGLAMPLIALVI
jgi:hypothetical protein